MQKLINTAFKGPQFLFSTVAKKKQMELTLRTPYQTILSNFTGFSRIITKSQQSTVVVQNRTPGALYVLPPGPLKVKLNQELKDTTGDYLHSGGWMIVHNDNSCEINLVDCFDKKDVRADQLNKTDVKDVDTISGKYNSKNRKTTSKVFEKKIAS